MPCIGIYGLFVRTKFGVRGIFVHIPIILQTSVITYTKDCIAIVKYHVGKRLVLVRVIPKRHHHVLHTLVNTSHNVRKHIVVAKVIHIKIVGQFGFEFRSIVLGGLYPRYNPLQIGWNFRAGLILGIDVVIVREACLKHFHPIRCAVIPLRREVVVKEHAHRIVVVQEFPAFRRVLSAELLRHPFLVVVARYVQEAEHGLRALVVVEVELPKELRRLVNAATVKQIARLAVYRCTHVILVTVVTVLLRRGELPCLCQYVLHQLCHTGVVRAGTFREVGLQAEAVHRRGLFLVAACRAEGVFRLFLQLAAHALLVTAEVQVAGHLRGVLEVDAVVLYRIGKRACALQADAAAHTAEVQRLAALHHAQHLVHVVLRVLVVVHRRLQHRGHAVVLPSGDDDVPHAVRHAVDCYVAAVVDHVVAVVQGHHAVRAVLVYHVGLKHLRVAQVRVVGTHEVHVGGRAVRAKFNI